METEEEGAKEAMELTEEMGSQGWMLAGERGQKTDSTEKTEVLEEKEAMEGQAAMLEISPSELPSQRWISSISSVLRTNQETEEQEELVEKAEEEGTEDQEEMATNTEEVLQ